MGSSFKRQLPNRILRVCRDLGYTLSLNAERDWYGFAIVLAARLEEQERASLAWAALKALPPDLTTNVIKSVLPHCVAAPLPPLLSHMDEAAYWADLAEPEALDAYCLAAFRAMSGARQLAFLEFTQGRQAA